MPQEREREREREREKREKGERITSQFNTLQIV